MSVYERLVMHTEASRNRFLAIPLLQRAMQGAMSATLSRC